MPTKIKKQLVQASMLVICLGFETGSRQREGSAPLSALPTVMLYLLSRTGLANSPKVNMFLIAYLGPYLISDAGINGETGRDK